MITILYTYKNKEVERVKRSLDSLLNQTNTEFKVLFVDFGSNSTYSGKLQSVLKNYSFASYLYSYHLFRPWSRAKAINIGLRQVDTPYVFVADIDMLFHKEFIATLQDIKSPDSSYYFKVGFLSETETQSHKQFEDYAIAFESTPGAQGLSLFPAEALRAIRGFDEFFHFWGGEDEDIHARLQKNGLKVNFFDEKILMLHQWHPTYRGTINKKLTTDIRHDSIARINQEHLRMNRFYAGSIRNPEQWGKIISKEEFEKLSKPDMHFQLSNKKAEIDNFLFSILRQSENKIVKVIIRKDEFPNTVKYHIKKAVKKNVPEYYTMKQVNDVLLLHLIAFHNNAVYKYKVGDDLNSITLTLQL
ncbi:MAG: glycosyltransferase family 2 protein [Flavobacterium sp.]